MGLKLWTSWGVDPPIFKIQAGRTIFLILVYMIFKSKKPKIRGFGWSFNGMRKVGVWGTPRIGQIWLRTNLGTFCHIFCHIKDRRFKCVLYIYFTYWQEHLLFFFLWIYFKNWQEYTNINCIISFRYIPQIGKKLWLIC